MEELEEFSKLKDELINSLNEDLSIGIQKEQSLIFTELIKEVVDNLELDNDKRIINNQKNRALILKIDDALKQVGKLQDSKIANLMIKGVGNVLKLNNNFYSTFEDLKKIIPITDKIQKSIKGWLGIEDTTLAKNGYLDVLIKSEQVKNQIKDAVVKSVYGQVGWNDTKNNLSNLIKGNKESLGAFEKYHRNFSYDLYSQIDRATSKSYADSLKFEFAIYEGGLIKTSREFCKKHNGKVYHRTEIQAFRPKVAIPDNYDPFTDLGGYGCRHQLNWIPTSLAKIIRPDVIKFL